MTDNNIVDMAQGADATNEEKVINMIFPSVLVEQLEDLFEGDKIDFNKVLFTVYFINKGKWNGLKNKYEAYQEVSSRYGNWISLVGKKGTDFIKKLIQGGIIKKTSGYVTAKHYTRYTLVNPFNYKGKDAKGDDYRLYRLTAESGAYASKYINDGFTVRIPTNKTEKKVIEPVTQVTTTIKKNESKEDMENVTQELAELRGMVAEQARVIQVMQENINAMQEGLDLMQVQIKELQLNKTVAKDTTNIEKIIASNPLWGKALFNDDDEVNFGEVVFTDKLEIAEEPNIEIQPTLETLTEEPKYNPDVLRIVKRHSKNPLLIRKIAEAIKATKRVPSKEDIYSWGDGISGASVNKMYTELQEVV